MTQGMKISIQTWSAIAMLTAGTVMAFVSLFLPPMGEISNGALWYTGQCFLYAGGIFGIGTWAVSKGEELDRRMRQVDKEVERMGRKSSKRKSEADGED